MKNCYCCCVSVFGLTVADKRIRFKLVNPEHQLRVKPMRLRYNFRPASWNKSMRLKGGALRLGLIFTYSNPGNVPVLVDKKSSWVYRILVSANLKKALQKEYQYDARLSYSTVNSMREAGMRMDRDPERDAFVVLKPGESHSFRQEITLYLYDGTKDTQDGLHLGAYYLQLKVATWYYFADPEVFQEKWKNEGYLWSRDITSEPMPLNIRKAW